MSSASAAGPAKACSSPSRGNLLASPLEDSISWCTSARSQLGEKGICLLGRHLQVDQSFLCGVRSKGCHATLFLVESNRTTDRVKAHSTIERVLAADTD